MHAMQKLLGALVVLLLAAGAAWILAGRAMGPEISIEAPGPLIGQRSAARIVVLTPDADLATLTVALEQNGQRHDLATLTGDGPLTLRREANSVIVEGEIGRQSVPALAQGPATITVSASRPVLFGLRTVSSESRQDVEVRLTPPVLAPLSQFHFINQGGSELVAYRVTPADAVSGVQVGHREYPGFPAAGAGIPDADPGLRVAFFALLHDQPVDAPIRLFARDAAGNEATAAFDTRVFPKRFRQSTITLDDRFLGRVVPPILQQTPDLQVPDPSDLLSAYLAINRDLRQQNSVRISEIARTRTAPTMLWGGPFRQMVNSAVEAGFADARTYIYQGREVDRQVHLGYDLASLQQAPIEAANSGRVIFAGYLGIYGNCVIVDHGLGVQSLYAHLSHIAVQEGDSVEKNGVLGNSGITGLAGGDHLHFTMLLNGEPVTPVDWWSAQWIQDRILRKLQALGRPAGD
jgi:murein DD-endopeptidase MepM/ murein hydrolase activator NlpD